MELLERTMRVRGSLARADTTTIRGVRRVQKTPDLIMAFGNPMKVCAPPTSSCHDDELIWESLPAPAFPDWCSARDVDTPIPSKPYVTCSKIDKVKDCTIGTVTASDVFGVSSSGDPDRSYQCIYDLDDLASSCEAATQYTEEVRVNTFGDRNVKWFDNGLMTTLCDKRGDPSKCPVSNAKFKDTVDGKTKCSSMMSCELCKSWALNGDKEGVDASDVIMERWCRDPANRRDQANPRDETKNDPSCKCKNRGDDEIFARTQQLVMTSPKCWYRACADTDMAQHMVESSMRSESCPSELCMINWNFEGATDIDLEDVTSTVSCQINTEDDGDDEEPSTGAFMKWFADNKTTIIVGTGGVIVLAGLLIFAKQLKKE